MTFKRLTLFALSSLLLLSGCSEVTTSNTVNNSSSSASTEKTGDYQSLANKDFENGSSPFIEVNNNQAELDPGTWSNEHIKYSNLDQLNRAGAATAYLSEKNLGRSESRTEQTWQPTGWHNQPAIINGRRVFPQNRGHLIAYTVTFAFDQDGTYVPGQLGSLNNPKNLVTQTEFSNQKTMQIFEEKVRDSLAQHKQVIYKVTPIFRGNELMPRGVWSQAISTDKTLNFNVYIWNVEPGISFDYTSGRGRIDQTVSVHNLYKGNKYTNQRN
ncbi:DNA/RNA non-specific endonuclease (plasmid) [Latilactobacillus curvatus]|uniref:DNA/RNA non-specific endonuclease n=1 Tax=Latilactobacillus curvatus TaxID=28038 RepID=A0A385AGX9_LATCU|nr:DNA/RNA non-specific endonuclease [Latilactobacillus curvatus]AXN36881.1 DNA/RNA non-specific endonuclease [Latilactobacillus curvatus]